MIVINANFICLQYFVIPSSQNKLTRGSGEGKWRIQLPSSPVLLHPRGAVKFMFSLIHVVKRTLARIILCIATTPGYYEILAGCANAIIKLIALNTSLLSITRPLSFSARWCNARCNGLANLPAAGGFEAQSQR